MTYRIRKLMIVSKIYYEVNLLPTLYPWKLSYKFWVNPYCNHWAPTPHAILYLNSFSTTAHVWLSVRFRLGSGEIMVVVVAGGGEIPPSKMTDRHVQCCEYSSVSVRRKIGANGVQNTPTRVRTVFTPSSSPITRRKTKNNVMGPPPPALSLSLQQIWTGSSL